MTKKITDCSESKKEITRLNKRIAALERKLDSQRDKFTKQLLSTFEKMTELVSPLVQKQEDELPSYTLTEEEIEAEKLRLQQQRPRFRNALELMDEARQEHINRQSDETPSTDSIESLGISAERKAELDRRAAALREEE